MVYRCYKSFDRSCNIWDGPPMFVWELPFTVETRRPAGAGPAGQGDAHRRRRPGQDHALDPHLRGVHDRLRLPYHSQPEGCEERSAARSTCRWRRGRSTSCVKLIAHRARIAIETAAVPIEVDSDSLTIKFNPNHQVTVVQGRPARAGRSGRRPWPTCAPTSSSARSPRCTSASGCAR